MRGETGKLSVGAGVGDPVSGTATGVDEDPEGRAPSSPAEAAASDPTSTRERILDVALDLFIEKGYDGTSLREIAERLGFTKAALYYHFASKEDILMALHMRVHQVGRDKLAMLVPGQVTLEVWRSLLTSVLDQMLTQRKLFLMHERNQAALERLHAKDHEAEHEDMQDRFRQILGDTSIPLRNRVKMAASFGAIFSVLFLAGNAFEGTTEEELGEILRGTIRQMLD